MGGKDTKYGILERNVVYLWLNNSAELFEVLVKVSVERKSILSFPYPWKWRMELLWEPNDVPLFSKHVNYFITLYWHQKCYVLSFGRSVITFTLFIQQAFTEYFLGVSSGTSSAGSEVWPDVQKGWKERPVPTFMFFAFYLGKNINIWSGIWETKSKVFARAE